MFWLKKDSAVQLQLPSSYRAALEHPLGHQALDQKQRSQSIEITLRNGAMLT